MKNLLKTIKDFIHCMALFEEFKLTQDDEDFEEFRRSVNNFHFKH